MNRTDLDPGSNAIVRAREIGLSTRPDLTEEVAKTEKQREGLLSANTRRTYEMGWRVFVRWCEERELHPGGPPYGPATPMTVCMFARAMSQGDVAGGMKKHSAEIQANQVRRPSSIRKLMSAINHYHQRVFRLPSPTDLQDVKDQLVSIDNECLGGRVDKKRPLTADEIIAAVAKVVVDEKRPEDGLRMRAVLLVGFGGGFRRDEMTRMVWSEIEEQPEGAMIHLARSKTDQTGVGRDVPILRGSTLDTCPVEALNRMRASNAVIGLDTTGGSPVFVSFSRNGFGKPLEGNSFAKIVKDAAVSIGLDPKKIGAHSLRAGFVTTARQMNVPDRQIMERTGHKNVQTLNGYDRTKYSWKNDATRGML